MKRTVYAFVSQLTGRHTAIGGLLRCSTTKCVSSGKYRDSVTVRISLAKFRRPLAPTDSADGGGAPIWIKRSDARRHKPDEMPERLRSFSPALEVRAD